MKIRDALFIWNRWVLEDPEDFARHIEISGGSTKDWVVAYVEVLASQARYAHEKPTTQEKAEAVEAITMLVEVADWRAGRKVA